MAYVRGLAENVEHYSDIWEVWLTRTVYLSGCVKVVDVITPDMRREIQDSACRCGVHILDVAVAQEACKHTALICEGLADMLRRRGQFQLTIAHARVVTCFDEAVCMRVCWGGWQGLGDIYIHPMGRATNISFRMV